MGQVIQVNGDYNIKAAEGATIKLDTGPNAGRVVITGDLRVEGDTVYVSAQNLDVEDNIITLNKGETGSGVTLDYSGLTIDRGTLDAANLLWNENIPIPTGQINEVGAEAGGWQFAIGPEGSYTFDNSRLKLRQIVTDPGVDNGDLMLIGAGIGVVKITGTTDYTGAVLSRNDNDVITNKGYVDYAIQNNPTFQILSNPPTTLPIVPNSSSRVIVTDKNTPGSLAYFTANTGYDTVNDDSAVSVLVDGTLSAQFYSDMVTIFDLQFEGTVISTKLGVTNENIRFNTQGTGKIQFNAALQLEHVASAPSYVPQSTLIYADDAATGDSGVWFVNDSNIASDRNGELISKKRALVFSMLF